MDKCGRFVVDDESSVCEAVKAILELEGLDVTTTLSSVDRRGKGSRKDGYDLSYPTSRCQSWTAFSSTSQGPGDRSRQHLHHHHRLRDHPSA